MRVSGLGGFLTITLAYSTVWESVAARLTDDRLGIPVTETDAEWSSTTRPRTSRRDARRAPPDDDHRRQSRPDLRVPQRRRGARQPSR